MTTDNLMSRTGLVDPKVAETVLQYLINRHWGDHWSSAGMVDGVEYERFVKAMSLREMITFLGEHGTDEDRRVVLGMLMPQFKRYRDSGAKTIEEAQRVHDRRPYDPKEEQRRSNIEQSKMDFDVTPPETLKTEIPAGPTWADFDTGYHRLSKVGHDAVRQWMHGLGRPILILGGATGGGKTMLAIMAATELDAGGARVIYRREQDLVGDIRRRSLGDKTDQDALKEYGWAPWLILDEFGGTRGTPLAEETLDQLIDYRWRGAESGVCRTLATTNLFAKDHEKRIASRMADTRYVKVVEMLVPDYRTKGRA